MTDPVMLYYGPHTAHETMAESVGAEMVPCNRGNPLERFNRARGLDFGDRPVITEGGKPLIEAVCLKLLGNCGPVIHLASDETFMNLYQKLPHYSHADRVAHYLVHKYVDAVIAVSPEMVVQANGIGVDTVKWSFSFTQEWKYDGLMEVSPDYGATRLLAAAHDAPKNNLGILEDVAQASQHDVHIDIIGNRTDQYSSAHVEGHGFVEQDEFIDRFANAAGLIFPAVSQAWGVATLEAMHAALPPIVTEDVGSHHYVAPIENNLVRQATVDSLARGVDWYFDLKPDERAALGADFREMGTHFAPTRGITQFKETYEQVLEEVTTE